MKKGIAFRTKRSGKSTTKRSGKKTKLSGNSTTKRIFFHRRKHFRGGRGPHTQELNQNANYPAVYGIDDKSVLYPISKYGIPAGFFDPPVDSNGPFGNGPINGPYLGMGGKSMKGTSKSKRSMSSHKKGKKSSRKSKRSKSRSKRSKSRSKRSRSRSKQSRSKKYSGGGNTSTLLPQTIVNTGRGLMESVYETANGFSGHTNPSSLNPMPYDQPIDADVQYLRTNFPNVAQNYNKADSYVSGI